VRIRPLRLFAFATDASSSTQVTVADGWKTRSSSILMRSGLGFVALSSQLRSHPADSEGLLSLIVPRPADELVLAPSEPPHPSRLFTHQLSMRRRMAKMNTSGLGWRSCSAFTGNIDHYRLRARFRYTRDRKMTTVQLTGPLSVHIGKIWTV